MVDELQARFHAGLYRTRRRLQSGQGSRVRINGQELLNFSSNDYLGLARHPELARAAARAAYTFGTGAGASPLVSGLIPPLRRLERALADWEGTQAALVFPSGFAANLGVLTALVDRSDVIFSDALNHASLIDGCRLSRARLQIYDHRNCQHLEELLAQEAINRSSRRRIIVTDTVFSMDGDVAPLEDLLVLARRYDTLLLADEAHATGVLGPGGRGVGEGFSAQDQKQRLIRVGTLSKALGGQGGFVLGSRLLAQWLINHSRPYIFSTALAPPIAAAARAALRVVAREPERRQRVLRLADRLRQGLKELGFAYGASSCQIVPVLGRAKNSWEEDKVQPFESARVLHISQKLRERGLLVPGIRPPSVPEGTARLRISLTAEHTEEDLEYLLKSLDACVQLSC